MSEPCVSRSFLVNIPFFGEIYAGLSNAQAGRHFLQIERLQDGVALYAGNLTVIACPTRPHMSFKAALLLLAMPTWYSFMDVVDMLW